MKKFGTSGTMIFIGVCIAVVCTFVTAPDVKKQKITPEEAKSHYPKTEESSSPASGAEQVSAGGKGPESYILQYNRDKGMVILITRQEDGTELVSHIKAINPDYLEPEDVNRLVKGIELNSKEEMFILIEDYSS